MTRAQRIRRRIALLFWKIANPLTRPLAGFAPWWVVLETTGRRSGRQRHTPLAAGPIDGGVAWLISVHGEHSAFARNIAANPRVRLRHRGRWRTGTASLAPLDDAVLRRFNAYARSATLRGVGIDPKLLRVELDPKEPE